MNLAYDTETSGLPEFSKPSNDPCQPHIIQIAAVLTDDSLVEQERMNVFIKPDGWVLPEFITNLTGITQDYLEEHGVPIATAVDQFLAMWSKSALCIAHNDSFDRRLLRIELARLFGKIPLLETWKIFPAFCTMKESAEMVNLPPTAKMLAAGFNKPKAPKLEEAYEYFYGKKPEKSHDAMADVESTLAVYKKIMELRA